MLPSADQEAVLDADLRLKIAQLESENSKLKKINAALIERVESRAMSPDDAYAAFQYSVELAEQVRERTDALNRAMAELKASNSLLSDARLRAETAHQHLIDAIESISDAFALFDSHERLVLFNSRFQALWHGKVPSGQITSGISLEEIKQLAGHYGLIAEAHHGSGDGQVLYRLYDGRWVQVRERQTRGGGLVILYTDITDVKNTESVRREQALAQKSDLLQRAIDNLSQGVVMVAADGALELWNHRFIDLCGLSPITHQHHFEAVMAESDLPLLTPFTRDQEGHPLQQLEQRLSSGQVLEIRTHPLPTGGFVNTFTDITERYQHAETLRQSERWIRLITDHVPALIAYLSADLVYLFTNRVYEEWYHWPQGAMLGHSLQEAHHEVHCHNLQPYIERALRGESVSFEMNESNLNGQNRCMLRSYVPNRTAEGQVVGIFVLVRDITDRRRTAEALHQAYQNLEVRVRERTAELMHLNDQLRREIEERTEVEARLREAKREAELANLSKTKFLAAVSHDLLQPLNAARLFTSAISEERDPSTNKALVSNLDNSLEDVENLLGTLVDISKLDAGVITPEISTFDIGDLLGNLAAEFTQLASAENLKLRFVPCSVLVRSDTQLLARILRNLLTNAIRYTSEGHILLGCRRRGNALSIEVLDTGMGIPKDKLQEVFQEFKRGEQQRPNQDRGLGLGLAIVDKIAHMLGHSIGVDSIPGKGSRFRVSVPMTSCQPLPLHMASDVPEPITERLQSAKVWVVDNDAAICSGMHRLLSNWGCEVVTALSEEDLLIQVNSFQAPVDLLVVDYHLDNERTGVEVAAVINGCRTHPLPVLMITANYSNELKQQLKDLGHVLLHKPVKPLKLKIALSHLLERANHEFA